MPKLLTGNAQKGWPYMQRLLVDLFQFLEPFLRNSELEEAVCLCYLSCNLFLCFPLLLQLVEPCILLFLILLQVHFLYKGKLRVLLVLLHDYPEFLCDYHFSFCDVIPPSCIQMRNIIISAFPCNMRLPDPSTPNLKVSLSIKMPTCKLFIKLN